MPWLGPGSWFRSILTALTAVVLSIVLLIGWLFLVLEYRIHPFIVLASIPVLAFAILSIGQALSKTIEPEEEVAFRPSWSTIPWRLHDPMLSTFGLWRAEVRSHPLGLDEFEDRKQVGRYAASLLRDWSLRAGYPFYHSRVLRVSKADPKEGSPFGTRPESGTVFRVILDAGTWRYPGWIRFGDRFVEFQLERDVRQSAIPAESCEPEASQKAKAPEFGLAVVRPEMQPLWDRWLDG
jgi:hypothetical protein